MASSGRFTGALCVLALSLIGFCAGHTQTTPESALLVQNLGRGTQPLAGAWKFHPGDDPTWASPEFNDSGWSHIDISRPWGD